MSRLLTANNRHATLSPIVDDDRTIKPRRPTLDPSLTLTQKRASAIPLTLKIGNTSVEDYSDDLSEKDHQASSLGRKLQTLGGKLVVSIPATPVLQVGRNLSSAQLREYSEVNDGDFEDVYEGSKHVGLQLNTRLSSRALEDFEEEEDPFAQIDSSFEEDNLETSVSRERDARMGALMAALLAELQLHVEDHKLDGLPEICEQLIELLPAMQAQLIAGHGMLVIIEVLRVTQNRRAILGLLTMINLVRTAPVLVDFDR